MNGFDYIIIGTGAGGGTIASKLAETNKRILIVERGPFLQRGIENWQPKEVFYKGKYAPPEKWLDKNKKEFVPGTHYFVGGNTKFYGAALLRLREGDFNEIKHYGGLSPAWPLKYNDFQPYYNEAETLYEVHGKRGEDPTEPPETAPYAFPEVSHEPQMQEIYDKLIKQNHKPFHLPLGIRLKEKDMLNSLCVRCETCDGYPCLVKAKSDAQHICLDKVLKNENVTLITEARVSKLVTDESGTKVTSILVERNGKEETYHGKTVIVSCGAINSAALFLRSKSEKHPNGLANSSDQVGRNYMCHQNSVVLGIHKYKNEMKFQKTLGLNDFYHKADDSELPLGHIQMLGKVEADMLKGDAPFFTPNFVLQYLASHSIGWWLTSEDLPLPENRVVVDENDRINLLYSVNNSEAHKRLVKKLKKILNFTGHRFHLTNSAYLKNRLPVAAVAHQVGTMRFGTDPKTSVLDTNCKVHDLENVYVVDGSFFPSSGAVNPGLTIIANALRIGDHIASK
ncbi:MAG: Paromamine 6'-oxidase [Chlamydiia bacterium]|nr:Paromamine 6'-oxidase [Chlamydiia bacterium]